VIVIMIFKKTTNSASTSVKGRKVTTPPKAVKKTVQVVRPVMKNKGTVNTPFNSYPNRRTMNKHPVVSAYVDKRHNGVRVRGTAFIQDLVVWSSTDSSDMDGQTVKFSNLIYASPALIPGRVSLMAKAFTKYRFDMICLSYRGHFSSATDGEVFIAYCDDPSMNPTELVSRQIKVFMDNMDGTDAGPVYNNGRKTCATAHPTEKDKFYEISKDHQNVEDVMQGKFICATTNCKESSFGELIVEYDLVLVDNEVSVHEILSDCSTSNSGALYALRFEPQNIGSASAVALSPGYVLNSPNESTSYVNMKTGLYSCFVPTDPIFAKTQVGPWSRPGVEMFASVFPELGVAGSYRARIVLFASLADMIAGVSLALQSSIVSTIVSSFVQMVSLLVDESNFVDPGYELLETPLARKFKGHRDHIQFHLDNFRLRTKEQVVLTAPPTPTGDLVLNQGERIAPRSLDRYYSPSPLGYGGVTPQ
jgi:hypothetical protein